MSSLSTFLCDHGRDLWPFALAVIIGAIFGRAIAYWQFESFYQMIHP